MVSLKGILPNKSDLALAAGAAVSSTITGLIQGYIPINLEFLPGATDFIIGTVLAKTVLKKGIARDFAKGIQLAGLSNMISGFIPQLSGSFPNAKKFNLARQVDGLPHSKAPFGVFPGAGMLHRNPVIDTATETKVAPRGAPDLRRGASVTRIRGPW